MSEDRGKRWNGWGDASRKAPLSESVLTMLDGFVGKGTPVKDATLEEVTRSVPESRLKESGNVRFSTDPEVRARHARGQSLPDWIALRSGRISTFPDAVATPASAEEVTGLIRFAREGGVSLIPYGGGTSVAGHVNPESGDRPVLTVDLGKLSTLTNLDERSQLATFGAGVLGPDLEAQLARHNYTLGHFPQSFEYSTLGGWVVTRSSGQQSLGFGRIEKLFAGGKLETPLGTLEMPPFPASAAGPDVREMVLGSEGRMGILTEATVRVTPVPEKSVFHALFFPTLDQGFAAIRAIVQARLPLSMLRLSTPLETTTSLAIATHRRLVSMLESYLSVRGVKDGKSLLLVGITGNQKMVKVARREAFAIARLHGGVHVGRGFGKEWEKGRFAGPFLRNSLWDKGYAVDTLETATTWTQVPGLLSAIEQALRTAITHLGEKVHAFTHLSHAYPTGSSLYTTYVFRMAKDPEETLHRWVLLKGAASRAIVANGGTISHQHGVGVDHAPYLSAEKGRLGMSLLDGLVRRFDPDGVMNPGKLLR